MDTRRASWQAREHLLAELRNPAIFQSIDEAEAGSWTRTREDQLLDYVERFVDNQDFITPAEWDAYGELLQRPRRHRYANHTRKTAAAPVRAERIGRDPEVAAALSALTNALVARAISQPKIGRDHGDPDLSTSTMALEEELYRSGGDWPVGLKRAVLARLCWARNELAPSRDSSLSTLLTSWWALLREIDDLGPAALPDLDLELNTTANLLRLSRDLSGIRAAIAKPHKWTEPGALQLGEELDELSRYLTDLLVARLPTLLATASAVSPDVDPGDEETVGGLILLSLRVLLQYQNVFFRRRLRRLSTVRERVHFYAESGLELSPQGRCVPSSATWARYGETCARLRGALDRYVKATANGGKVKPYVLLVVGNPGTGKSDLVQSLVLPALSSSGTKLDPVRVDLSQARSAADALDVAWRVLKLRNDPVKLVILEEFDTDVGGLDQFRLALQPLWEGAAQVVGSDGVTPTLQDVLIGPFVAVCMMSRVATANEARQFFSRVSKGIDFLSRVDMIVEIPGFDSGQTQVDLIASMIGSQWLSPKSNEATIDEAALLFLGSMDATDNFRSIAKALKTAPKGQHIAFDALNVDSSRRLVFELLLAELSTKNPVDISEALTDTSERDGAIRFRIENGDGAKRLRAILPNKALCLGTRS